MGLISETVHDFNFKHVNTTDIRAAHSSASCMCEFAHLLGNEALILLESCRVTYVHSPVSRQRLNSLIDIMETSNLSMHYTVSLRS